MIARHLLAAILSLILAGPALAQSDPERLVEAMQKGGTVVFLRRAATVESQIDTGRLENRAGQRNLSEAGTRQAKALGAAFEALDIAFARILVSPVFRSRDTGEFAFGVGRVEVTMDLVADDYAGPHLGRMLAATERLLTTQPEPKGANILLVGHRTPLEMVTRRSFGDDILPEGAMAIFAPSAEATRLLGTLIADDLIDIAEAP
ncbi:histidine phosphatase family protein [Acuticoccus sp. MNP-M23]|uniref:histidine phosphatase family protein n=1 Tax=Acuticoccus sp. MNP-M23 TaxID=3072793 RepID=UPI0028161FC8|nr:histidine phosphatase family protein [Acuticoccus sp. MNP-M23]WMS41898.1 histidine phosphatase family protein [Acuticoccus sp. MNP-M23]